MSAMLERHPKKAKPIPSNMTVNEAQIRERAYDMYLARGCQHGGELADWFEAERQLHDEAEQEAIRARKTQSATAGGD